MVLTDSNTLQVLLLAYTLKCLVFFGYRSTDFEVHRNWLAVTYSRPLAEWYREATSEWTLDYPPLFAFFEWALSQLAVLVDPKMVRISKSAYASTETIVFQRLTVLFSEIVLLVAVVRLSKALQQCALSAWPPGRTRLAVFACFSLYVLNPGIFMIDNIHFQYNGFLFGILLLSATELLKNNVLTSAVIFSVLLNFKHIFLYVAPTYFCYMLRTYCFPSLDFGEFILPKRNFRRFSIANTIKLGLSVLSIFVATFLPFVASGGAGVLKDILARLFPFKRGLTHAYWAPNAWALYNAADFTLHHLRKILPFLATPNSANSPSPGYTTGLVQEFDHTVLPNISPRVTAALTLCFMLPLMLIVVLLGCRSKLAFMRLVSLFALSSYQLGWHVHEKAVLMVIIPLTATAVLDRRDARIFLLTSTIGHASLMPLLFSGPGLLIKHLAVWGYALLALYLLTAIHPAPSRFCPPFKPRNSDKKVKNDKKTDSDQDAKDLDKHAELESQDKLDGDSVPIFPIHFLSALESIYLYGLVLVHVGADLYPILTKAATAIIPGFEKLSLDKLQFLPLMLISTYSALGMLYCWVLIVWRFLDEEYGLGVEWRKRGWRKTQERLKSTLILNDTEPWQSALVVSASNRPPVSPVPQESDITRKRQRSMKRNPSAGDLHRVAGFDVTSFDGDDATAVASVVLLEYPSMKVLEEKSILVTIDAPYVPGFLAFRECPVMLQLLRLLDTEPQVCFIDGNGILHPNEFGSACQFGVLADRPTIGVAKNLHHLENLEDPGQSFDYLQSEGQNTPLLSRDGGRVLGVALRTTTLARNPVFVSVGHRIDLAPAVHLTLAMAKYRVPEPIRLARNPVFVSVGQRIDLAPAVHLTLAMAKYRVPEPIRLVGYDCLLNRAGVLLRTTTLARNPVFVSVGHRIDLAPAVHLTLAMAKYRVPEPIRLVGYDCLLNRAGVLLRTTTLARNPVFVSVGHRIDLAPAVHLTLAMAKYRVPEPIRLVGYDCLFERSER